MKDIMIDLETMGTNPDCAIIQLGACRFNRYTGEIGKEFIQNVELQSCIDLGCSITGDTVYWWLQQSDAARQSIGAKGLPVKFVLHMFAEFVREISKSRIWSHEGFDLPIMKSLYSRCNMPEPWSYNAGRGIRVVIDLADIDYRSYTREGVAHDALADCKHQVRYLTDAIKKLRRHDAI